MPKLRSAVLGCASALGLEPGSLFLDAVLLFCNAIADHARAAGENDANVKEAARRAQAARELVETLANAEFPENHMAFAHVTKVMYDLNLRASKWRETSRVSRYLAMSRTGQSKAQKYRSYFQQMFALFDRALQELMDAVLVSSFSNLQAVRVEFSGKAAGMRREFDAAAVMAGEQATTQAEVLAALGKQGASVEALLVASRANGAVLAAMEGRLGEALAALKEDLAKGVRASIAAERAAVKAAEALQEGRAEDRAAAVAELKADLLERTVPELLDALVGEGKLTRETVDAAKCEVVGEVRAAEESLGGRISASEQVVLAAIAASEQVALATQNELGQSLKHLLEKVDESTCSASLPQGTINVEYLRFVKGKAGKVGAGGQGTVRLAELTLPGAPRTFVAVKTVAKDDQEVREALLCEVKILRKLQHKHVVGLIGVSMYENDDGDEMTCAVLELCLLNLESALVIFSSKPSSAGSAAAAKFLTALDRELGGAAAKASAAEEVGGTQEARRRLTGLLGSALGSSSSSTGAPLAAVPPTAAAWRVLVHTATALCYMHGMGVVHGDVKPANVLIDAHGVVKLSDYGMSRAVSSSLSVSRQSSTQSGSGLGTIGFTAPEVMNAEKPSKASDVFSLGVTFACTLSGSPSPFDPALPPAAVIALVGRGERPPLPPSALSCLVQRMWHRNAASRPTSPRVLADLQDTRQGRPVAAITESNPAIEEEEKEEEEAAAEAEAARAAAAEAELQKMHEAAAAAAAEEEKQRLAREKAQREAAAAKAAADQHKCGHVYCDKIFNNGGCICGIGCCAGRRGVSFNRTSCCCVCHKG